MSGWWTTLIVGLAVLLFGRRLFWLFVGAIGFAVGLHVARVVLADRPEWVVLAAALVLGLGGAVLAIAFQWLAVGVGGFAAGVEGTLLAAGALGWDGPWLWAVAFAAGVVVAMLVLWLWDPVLIALSTLTGAALLAPLIPGPPLVWAGVFVGLLVLGIVVQTRVLGPPPAGGKPPRHPRA